MANPKVGKSGRVTMFLNNSESVVPKKWLANNLQVIRNNKLTKLVTKKLNKKTGKIEKKLYKIKYEGPVIMQVPKNWPNAPCQSGMGNKIVDEEINSTSSNLNRPSEPEEDILGLPFGNFMIHKQLKTVCREDNNSIIPDNESGESNEYSVSKCNQQVEQAGYNLVNKENITNSQQVSQLSGIEVVQDEELPLPLDSGLHGSSANLTLKENPEVNIQCLKNQSIQAELEFKTENANEESSVKSTENMKMESDLNTKREMTSCECEESKLKSEDTSSALSMDSEEIFLKCSHCHATEGKTVDTSSVLSKDIEESKLKSIDTLSKNCKEIILQRIPCDAKEARSVETSSVLSNGNEELKLESVDTSSVLSKNNESKLKYVETSSVLDNEECVESKESFVDPSSVMSVVIEDILQQCSHCDTTFADLEDCNKHEVVHIHNDSLEPNKTDPISKDNYERREATRKMLNGVIFRCTQCMKRFKSKGNLLHHMREHGEKHICFKCGKVFKYANSLVKHTRTHLYSCRQCPEVFAKKHELYKHSADYKHEV